MLSHVVYVFRHHPPPTTWQLEGIVLPLLERDDLDRIDADEAVAEQSRQRDRMQVYIVASMLGGYIKRIDRWSRATNNDYHSSVI